MIEIDDADTLVARIRETIAAADSTCIAIDGIDGAGKTFLARQLNSALGGSALSLDSFLKPNKGTFLPSLRLSDIRREVMLGSTPLIVEGICVLDVLERIDLKPTLHIYVKRMRMGRWEDEDECDPTIHVEALLYRMREEARLISRHLRENAPTDTTPALSGVREEIVRYHAKFLPARRADFIFQRRSEE